MKRSQGCCQAMSARPPAGDALSPAVGRGEAWDARRLRSRLGSGASPAERAVGRLCSWPHAAAAESQRWKTLACGDCPVPLRPWPCAREPGSPPGAPFLGPGPPPLRVFPVLRAILTQHIQPGGHPVDARRGCRSRALAHRDVRVGGGPPRGHAGGARHRVRARAGGAAGLGGAQAGVADRAPERGHWKLAVPCCHWRHLHRRDRAVSWDCCRGTAWFSQTRPPRSSAASLAKLAAGAACLLPGGPPAPPVPAHKAYRFLSAPFQELSRRRQGRTPGHQGRARAAGTTCSQGEGRIRPPRSQGTGTTLLYCYHIQL